MAYIKAYSPSVLLRGSNCFHPKMILSGVHASESTRRVKAALPVLKVASRMGSALSWKVQ